MKRYLEYWAQQTQWWCSRSFEWWAAHFTALYVGGAILIMGARFDELIKLELNAIGDLSAGVFGPVAFLWLVLGYLQQGRELKLSSEALRMQAHELKNSVEQQADLVAANREQNAAQVAAYNHERMRYERSMNAHILFSPRERVGAEGLFIHTFVLHNAGAEAIDVEFLCKIPGHNFSGTYAFLKRDEEVKMPITFETVKEDYSATLHCFYRTLDGRKIHFQKDLTISAVSQRVAIASFIKIEDI